MFSILLHQFISSRGNEYFCEIDEEYLTDRFNLTGLNTEVQYYQYALDLVTDVFDLDCDDEMREQIEKSARHLYGLVHARYIVTTRGLAKMVGIFLMMIILFFPHTTHSFNNKKKRLHYYIYYCARLLLSTDIGIDWGYLTLFIIFSQLDKYKKGDFGKCPRVHCDSHPLLPMGMSDNPNVKPVKLYCAKCEDLYNPKSSRHAAIDGAYFGTSFHNILFQVYPALIPRKSIKRYEPRVFGFKVHAAATLARWQSYEREKMEDRLRKLKMDTGFEDPEDDLEDDDDDDDEE